MLFHGVVLTLIFALGKLLHEEIGRFQMLFLYNFAAFIFLATFLLAVGFKKIKTDKIWIHIIRSLLNIAGYAAYFYGIEFISLDSAAAISFLLPILVSYLGTVIYNEKMTRARFVALISGFCGIIIILRPNTDGVDIGALWILVSVITWALCDLITKKLGDSETAFNQAFYTTLFSSIFVAPFAYIYWDAAVTVDSAAIIALMGVLLICQVIAIFKSFQHADFSVVMPFDYFRLPISIMISYYGFGEVMTFSTVIGSLIIIGGGIYLIHHEHKKKYVKMPIS